LYFINDGVAPGFVYMYNNDGVITSELSGNLGACMFYSLKDKKLCLWDGHTLNTINIGSSGGSTPIVIPTGESPTIGRGSFNDAYLAAQSLDDQESYFMWILEGTDETGADIKKIIWHIGNSVFIDANGGIVEGTIDGFTVNQ
jgi:hypothetical protein